MKQILDILNPVHLPTVSEWIKIAEIAIPNNSRRTPVRRRTYDYAIQLMQRFEELTRGKWTEKYDGHSAITGKEYNVKSFQPALLKKEMFVCDLENPVTPVTTKNTRLQLWEKRIIEYQQAQEKIWFEGFIIKKGFPNLIGSDNWNFSFKEKNLWFDIEGIARINEPTVYDFIYYCDRYNYTAKKPIRIMFNESFVKALLII